MAEVLVGPTPVTPTPTPTPVPTPTPTPISKVPAPQPQEGRQKATFNLSNIGKVQKTAEETPVNTNKERVPDRSIDVDVLQKAWEEFIQIRKATTPDLSMMTRGYSLQGTIIKMTLAGNVEDMLFQQLRTSLITFLRDRTGNSSLLIQTEITEQPTGERKFHTPREKFEHLAEKNPVLKDMKERFGLDPDLA